MGLLTDWFGTMEFYDLPFILGISSSQLTKSIIFQRGRRKTTNEHRTLAVFFDENWQGLGRPNQLGETTGVSKADLGIPYFKHPPCCCCCIELKEHCFVHFVQVNSPCLLFDSPFLLESLRLHAFTFKIIKQSKPPV